MVVRGSPSTHRGENASAGSSAHARKENCGYLEAMLLVDGKKKTVGSFLFVVGGCAQAENEKGGPEWWSLVLLLTQEGQR